MSQKGPSCTFLAVPQSFHSSRDGARFNWSWFPHFLHSPTVFFPPIEFWWGALWHQLFPSLVCNIKYIFTAPLFPHLGEHTFTQMRNEGLSNDLNVLQLSWCPCLSVCPFAALPPLDPDPINQNCLQHNMGSRPFLSLCDSVSTSAR